MTVALILLAIALGVVAGIAIHATRGTRDNQMAISRLYYWQDENAQRLTRLEAQQISDGK